MLPRHNGGLRNIILYKRYYTFTAARCVIGFAIAGIESACFVLVMELVGPSKRTLAGIVCWDAATCGILKLVYIPGMPGTN